MTLRIVLIASTALCALAGSALAQDGDWTRGGWYVGLGAGWEKPNDLVYSGLGNYGAADPDGGFIATGALGYEMGNWRIEIEGSGSHSKYVGNYAGGVIWTGASTNLLYDFHLAPRWKAYIGGGLGGGDLNREAYGSVSGAAQFAQWGLQWQAIGGVSVAVAPNFDMYAEYRYRGLQTGNTTLLYPAGGRISGNDERQNAVLVGIRWYPWAETVTPPPPPPPPAPPPPPPPPPPTKTFIVFFDFNKSDLTAEAQQVVQEAVKTLKEIGAVRVLVTGHTDTVGSDSYNMGLSVRRAETVKDEMVREGVEGSEISIEGKGFHDLLVPTGPGVREPQNRRAVIDLNG